MKTTNSKSTKSKPKTPARKRAPAPTRSRAPTAIEPVCPIEILERIAGNDRLKPTPRVAAAKALLQYKMAMLKATPATAHEQNEKQQSAKADRLAHDLNEAALRQMNPRGRA